MANIFIESFDNVAAADLILKGYTSGNAFAGATIGAGRTGNGLILDSTVAVQIPVNKILPANYSTIVFGGAFKTSSSFPNDQKIWSFSDNNIDQVNVSLTASGQLKFTNGAGTLLGYSNTAIYARGSFYFFDFKVVFSLTTGGSINYRVNSVAQAPITGVQTTFSTNAYCNVIKLWQRDAFASDAFVYVHDDLYANDTTGATNNDYMGDKRIFVQRPATAISTAWTPNGAGTNVGCVSEATPNYDTDYLSSNTPTQQDLYTLTSPPGGSGVISAVQTNVVARKDDGAARQIAPVLSDSTHSPSVGTTVSIGGSYVDYLQTYDINPLTGLAWTATDLTTLRLGVREIA